MKRTTRSVILCCMAIITAGCVGSAVHSTFKYNSVQSTISENNENLLKLNIGMSRDAVASVMGQPERSEGYAWGSAWLYRTAMTSGVYGTEDSDFTPVVFGQDGTLVGWGRNFFTEHVKKYEISVTN